MLQKKLIEHYCYPLLNSTCLPIWLTALSRCTTELLFYLSQEEKVKSLRRNTMVTITTIVLALCVRFSNISCVWGNQWDPVWLREQHRYDSKGPTGLAGSCLPKWCYYPATPTCFLLCWNTERESKEAKEVHLVVYNICTDSSNIRHLYWTERIKKLMILG